MAGQRRAPGGIGDRRQAEGRGGLHDGECRRCHWWGYRGTGWRRPATTAAAARQRHRRKHERRQLADRALVEYVHFIDKKYSSLSIRQYFLQCKISAPVELRRACAAGCGFRTGCHTSSGTSLLFGAAIKKGARQQVPDPDLYAPRMSVGAYNITAA